MSHPLVVHIGFLTLSLLLTSPFVIYKTESSLEITCIPSERDALLNFKHHLSDPSNRLSSWNASSNPNCCHWDAVVCSNTTSHVLELHLNAAPTPDWGFDDHVSTEDDQLYNQAYESSMLGGEVTHSLLDLKHLSYLDLSGNDFGGMQIPTFLCSISTLTYLNLSYSGFYGKIPPQIGNLSNLLYLDLAFVANRAIPYQITNLTNLIHLDLQSEDEFNENLNWLLGLTSVQYLDLSYANLSKSMDWLQSVQALPSLVELHLGGCTFNDYNQPSTLNFSSLLSLSISIASEWIFQLNNLVSLRLSPNYLSPMDGPIPYGIQNLTLLEHLDLFGNSFFSSIPNMLSHLRHLKFLILGGNQLSGTISDLVTNLTSLVSLDLSNNQFKGVIPTSLGNLTSLVSLDLSGNNLQGLIPTCFGKLTSLASLDLSSNQLEGVIPISLGNVISMINLDLSNNQLKGLIPSSLGNLTSLASLDLFNNQFEVIPPSLGNLVSLVRLDFSNCKLKGVIPTSLGNLISLVRLYLSNNQLRGVIPTSLGNLISLVRLDLSNNQLEGVIPMSLGNLTSLIQLDFSNNQLEGGIPSTSGNLSSLVNLDLSNNQLEGFIPTSLKKLCKIKKISFSNLKTNQQLSQILKILTPCISSGLQSLIAYSCQISGHIPNQLGMFKNLIRLDFHNNSIVGALPPTLGELSSLTFLDLSNNKLKGNPFDSLAKLSNLSDLYIHNNLFQGVVNEDSLASFATLGVLSASENKLTLKVGPSWQPKFQVLALGMSSWKLGPSFPSWIQTQKNLFSLDISNTGISDSIPTWFWSTIHATDYLNLSHNQIHGELPHTLKSPEFIERFDLSSNNLHGKLPDISVTWFWLDLSRNSFSGSITDFLCQKQDKGIFFLNLASNNLSGKIPDCWKQWSNLVDLNLQRNSFIGNLPSSMGSLLELQSLRLSNNILSGEFPHILKNTSNLISLDLGENNFTSDIPAWIGESLTNLKILRLRSNRFSGDIPNGICEMKFLQDLDLAQNSFSGNVPSCFNKLRAMVINQSNSSSFIYSNINSTQGSTISVFVSVKGRGVEYRNLLGLVKSIDLSDNRLSGEIPAKITKLSGLIYLNLSKNQLSGDIPQSIGNMGSLESIDLSRNLFSGEIPQTITELSFLNKLDVSYNHLKGEIPTGTQIQSFDASGFVGNDLCGPPLPIKCSLDGGKHGARDSDKESRGHGVNWVFVSMALGFIVGFWGVVAPLFICRSWRYAYFRFLDDVWYKLQSRW